MTDKQRDTGRLIAIAVLIIILVSAILSGCSSMLYPSNQVMVTHVLALTEMGAIVAPPVPAFYAKPKSLDEMIDHTIGRVFDLFEIETNTVRRWKDDKVKL